MKTNQIRGDRREYALLGIALLILTLILQPWRNSLSQDDAAYAWASIHWSWDNPIVHPAQLAAAWPQVILGALTLKWIPASSSFSIAELNELTWIFFIFLIGWVKSLTRHSSILVLSFFLFPLWVQYGASFLSDIYAAVFLVAVLSSLQAESKRSPWNVVGLISVTALILQRQTMAAFPFFWGLSLLSKNERRISVKKPLLLLGGTLLGIGIYFLLPVTPFQKGFAYWRWIEWKGGQSIAYHIYDFIMRLFQSSLGFGIFLIPFINLKKLKWHLIFPLQLIVWMSLWFSSARPMSAGVFFIDYFPRQLGFGLLSLGVWGWTVLFRLRPYCGVSPLATLMASLAVLVFYIFQSANDIRYFMILALPVLFHLESENQKTKMLGQFWIYLGGIFALSVLVNLYNLNTTEMRWKVANQLREKGVSSRDISAGYGHDFYYLGADCLNRILEKIEKKHPNHAVESEEFYRFLILSSRYFEEGWKSRFTIKPNMAFGKRIGLPVVESLQNQMEKTETIPYSVLGIPNELILIERKDALLAECFKQDEAK